jgi:hypothetical protein
MRRCFTGLRRRRGRRSICRRTNPDVSRGLAEHRRTTSGAQAFVFFLLASPRSDFISIDRHNLAEQETFMNRTPLPALLAKKPAHRR